MEIYTACGTVTHMAISAETLFVATDDGLLLMFDLLGGTAPPGVPRPGPSMTLLTSEAAAVRPMRLDALRTHSSCRLLVRLRVCGYQRPLLSVNVLARVFLCARSLRACVGACVCSVCVEGLCV